MNLKQKFSEKQLPNILRNQKFYFIFFIYEIYLISAKGYKNEGVELLRVKKLVKSGQK